LPTLFGGAFGAVLPRYCLTWDGLHYMLRCMERAVSRGLRRSGAILKPDRVWTDCGFQAAPAAQTEQELATIHQVNFPSRGTGAEWSMSKLAQAVVEETAGESLSEKSLDADKLTLKKAKEADIRMKLDALARELSHARAEREKH